MFFPPCSMPCHIGDVFDWIRCVGWMLTRDHRAKRGAALGSRLTANTTQKCRSTEARRIVPRLPEIGKTFINVSMALEM